MGLERAGWRTVSFSEIDPYASAVLARHWPGVPNLGDITSLRTGLRSGRELDAAGHGERTSGRSLPRQSADAALWTGGFPCQDLSVAGKRRGLAGEQSGLAFTFLDLVERHRPPAVLLENVPGLLSSHRGKDLGALLGRLGELGYGWAYRVLDARHFGVPQRRRRVFILALHSRVDPSRRGAAEVLSVGARCHRHPATGHQAGPKAADGDAHGVATAGADSTRTVQAAFGHHGYTLGAQDADGGYIQVVPARQVIDTIRTHVRPGSNSDYTVLSPPPHPRRDRETDGLAGRLDDRTARIAAADDLLPDGLDSHRYRCCGNGVVAPVGEWIGRRLAGWFAMSQERTV